MQDLKEHTSDFVRLKIVCVLAPIDALEHPSVPVLFIVGYDLDCILHHTLHESFGDMGAIVHGGTHINFNEPGIVLFVNHKIIPNKLTAVPASRYPSLAAFYAPDNDILHAFLDFFPSIFTDVLCKLIHGPHIPGYLGEVEFGVVLLDGVVSEMDVSVVDVLEVVLLGTESDVALVVEPDFGRVEVLD